MKDILMLLDAIHLPLCRPEYQPKEGVTHCNQYINEVCQAFGWKGFEGLLANQIVDLMASNDAWSEVSMDKCQFLSNQGTLIVAGIKEEGHGHVCVVVPGKEKTSGRWGQVPSIANVGKEVFIGKGLSYGFSSMPKFWALRSTL